MTNIIEIVVKGQNALKPTLEEAKRDAKAMGQQVGDEFGKSAGDQAATTTTQRLRDARGRFISAGQDSGEDFTQGLGDKVKDELPPKIEDPLEDSGKKGGKKAGAGAAAAMSPLLLGAFAAAATAGPGLILAATATAVLGAGALITKGNADLQSSYAQLGRDASDMIETATAPLIPALQGAVTTLDQGIGRTGGELESVFAAVAPMAQDMARGVLSLVDNALPGMATGLREIAPFSGQIADDFGKLGSGISGLFSGLGSGASGGMTGFSALIDLASHLLTDVGQIVGALSNGLGPALHDVDVVAVPLAGVLTDVVKAFPPDMIRMAADATLALFAAFKVASLAGVLAEGTTFLGFLGSAVTGEVALAEETVTLSGAMTKLGAASLGALGPLGVLAGVTTGLYFAIKNDNGSVQGMLDKVEAEVNARRQQLDVLTQATKAEQTHGDVIDVLTQRLTAANLSTQDSARQSAAATLAALGFSDGEGTLATSLNATLQAFDENSNAASALKQAYDALFGKYANYSDAQAQFTLDLENVAKKVTAGKDAVNLSSDAGANNLKVFKQLADANETRAEALLRETGSQDQANQSLQQGALALDAAAKKAGFTKGQIDALNLALFGTKNLSNLKITVGADTSAAINAVNNSLRYIDNQVAYIQVQAIGGAPGGKQLLAHGGVVGSVGAAATGGVHGSLTLINEQGPELVRLPSGSTVFTNPDSQQMLQQAFSAAMAGGGMGAAPQLEWYGSPDPVLDALWTALRGHIRIRGGTGPNSVQLALGQAF